MPRENLVGRSRRRDCSPSPSGGGVPKVYAPYGVRGEATMVNRRSYRLAPMPHPKSEIRNPKW